MDKQSTTPLLIVSLSTISPHEMTLTTLLKQLLAPDCCEFTLPVGSPNVLRCVSSEFFSEQAKREQFVINQYYSRSIDTDQLIDAVLTLFPQHRTDQARMFALIVSAVVDASLTEVETVEDRFLDKSEDHWKTPEPLDNRRVLQLLFKALQVSNPIVYWPAHSLTIKGYSIALEMACKTGRPVQYLRWGQEIPIRSLVELFRKDVSNFLHRRAEYVSLVELHQQYTQLEELMSETCIFGRPWTHQDLSNLAGFTVNSSGLLQHSNQSIHNGSERTSEDYQRTDSEKTDDEVYESMSTELCTGQSKAKSTIARQPLHRLMDDSCKSVPATGHMKAILSPCFERVI